MAGLLKLLGGVGVGLAAGRDFIGETRARIQQPAAEMRAKIATGAQAKLQEILQQQQEAAAQRQASQQAPGLAAALGRQAPPGRAGGMIGAGWDPQSDQAQAVGLMMDPGTRQLGNAMAAGLMDPVQRQGLANAKQQGALLGVQTEAAQFGLEQARLEGPLNLQAARELIASRQAAAQASAASAEAAAAGRIDPLEARINQRWLANLTEPVAVQDSLQQIEGALGQSDSLGAVAAMIKLAKILDPTSVVREGEVTTVQGGTGTAQALLSSINKIKGGGLTPQAAADVLRTAKTIAVPILTRGQQITDEVRKQATDYGVNPDRVTTGIGWQPGYTQALLEEMKRAD
jgi:hypothetical protein